MSSRAVLLAVIVSLQLLPAPFQTPWFRKATRVVPVPDALQLKTPPGFSVNVFAGTLEFARFMALAPNGDVFLAEPVRGAGRITVLRDADHDGVAEMRETFATGLNRPFGLAFWKNYLYLGKHLDPTVNPQRPDLVGKATAPDVLLPAHSAALRLAFYTGTQFPSEYRTSAFVALHGSINRSKLSGYAVVRVPFRYGKPAGPPEDFLTGFIARDDDEKEVWGRPVGLLQLPDGSLLVSDDGSNRIWRVRYGHP